MLLLDEPTEGLEPVPVENSAAVLEDIASCDVTVLITEQNVGFALTLAERAHIIEGGENARDGSIADLCRREGLLEESLSVGVERAE
ncbi:hypothetical protein [Halorientalis sp.]|uniref:hypothetical protein n=1 Tax=Halorientalis sp. TaxID=1931229 RepID=UPI0026390E26|nr:hypothetical protein [Halorientalis sp.]